jgi:plasmid stabilization system protein ParE
MANWLPAAEQDAAVIVDYYDGQQPGLGALFFAAVYRTVTDVDAMPRAAAVVILPDTRRVAVGNGFATYGVYYRETAGAVLVVAILHLRRDPNWIQHLVQQR